MPRSAMQASRIERTAKMIIEVLTPELNARYVSSQSHGEPDFELYRGTERVGIMEVTSSTNQALRAATDRVARGFRRGPFLQQTNLLYRWVVRPSVGAHIGRIERMIGARLAEVEREGLTRFSMQRARTSSAVRRIVAELGVVSGDRYPADGSSGGVCITYPQTSAAVHVVLDHVFTAVEAEANKPDNRRKLCETGEHAERHLFVVVDPDNHAPVAAMNHLLPPEGAVCALSTATHFWIAAGSRAPGSWVVWYARRGEHWEQAVLEGAAEPGPTPAT